MSDRLLVGLGIIAAAVAVYLIVRALRRARVAERSRAATKPARRAGRERVFRLLVPAGPPDEHAAVTRIGGRPLAPPGTEWPRCATCREPMQFAAQVSLGDAADPALGEGLLLIFLCDTEGDCESWDPDSGCNHAVVVPLGGLTPLAPPPGARRTLLDRIRGVSVRPAVAPPVEPGEEDGPESALDRLRESGEIPEILGHVGGSPAWIQGDEEQTCDCGAPMRFVAQLEEQDGAINFGDAGVGYALACARCSGKAKLLWQCG